MVEWVAYVPLRTGLDEFENEYNIKIPSDLKEIIQKYNKGCPKKSRIPLSNGSFTEIYRLISFSKTGNNNVYSIMKLFEEKRIIPFAMTESNKYICVLDNKIVLYKIGKGVEFEICSNVTELLQLLY